MWQHLKVAAGPGWLPQLVAVGAAAAEFERPHDRATFIKVIDQEICPSGFHRLRRGRGGGGRGRSGRAQSCGDDRTWHCAGSGW